MSDRVLSCKVRCYSIPESERCEQCPSRLPQAATAGRELVLSVEQVNEWCDWAIRILESEHPASRRRGTDEINKLRDLALAGLATREGERDESCWLIERYFNNQHEWLVGWAVYPVTKWTTNASEAIHFSRESDALAVWSLPGIDYDAIVTGHTFINTFLPDAAIGEGK